MKASVCALALVCMVAQCIAFVTTPMRTPVCRGSVLKMAGSDEISDWQKDFPLLAKNGWGLTAKAERWNGRHAMFGWVVIVASAFAKSHGLIPDADAPLSLSDWGTLAILQGTDTITNERAVILVAHIHLLMVSIGSAIAPLSFQDKFLLSKEDKDEPAGLLPPFEIGLTKGAELWNGRVAMFAIIWTIAASLYSGSSFLDTLHL